jgi:pimeloyl-ACP methyl ester carboxylesterase
MILIPAAILLAAVATMAAFLVLHSPGKPMPVKGPDGTVLPRSITEKVFMDIGGVRQGMFIVGRDTANPVLLYLHGGPAFPNYFLIDRYKPGLENLFTVCYWEQRGGGLSYNDAVTPESMTFAQLVSDALEVTQYLRKRFGKEKIYLMAHSGGTPIAILAASEAPELYHAYIGMAQISNQAESEKIAYQYIRKQYRLKNDKSVLKALDAYPVMDSDTNILPFYQSLVRDKTMHALGIGTMKNMRSVFKDVFVPVWTCRAYTLNEKRNIWKSKFTFLKKTPLTCELFDTSITMRVKKLEVPVYFLSGRYDLTVNHEISREYLERIEAPEKKFILFENSAHSPLYEEPEKVLEILEHEVLRKQKVNGIVQ